LIVEALAGDAPGGGDGPGLIPVGPGGAAPSVALMLAALAIILAVLGLGVLVFRRNQRSRA
jgi:hypothetical protein